MEVVVLGVGASAEERLDGFLESWKRDWFSPGGRQAGGKGLYLPGKKYYRSCVTDREGRVRIKGVGVERTVVAVVRGPGIAQAAITILARQGLDPAPYNHAAQNYEFRRTDPNAPPPVLYGPTFVHVASPGRTITGIVRESGSREPVAGIVVTWGSTRPRREESSSTMLGAIQLAR